MPILTLYAVELEKSISPYAYLQNNKSSKVKPIPKSLHMRSGKRWKTMCHRRQDLPLSYDVVLAKCFMIMSARGSPCLSLSGKIKHWLPNAGNIVKNRAHCWLLIYLFQVRGSSWLVNLSIIRIAKCTQISQGRTLCCDSNWDYIHTKKHLSRHKTTTVHYTTKQLFYRFLLLMKLEDTKVCFIWNILTSGR